MWLARACLAAKGASYALVGVLASIARHAYGEVLLVALAIGFAAPRRFAQTFFDRSGEGDGPKGLDGDGPRVARRPLARRGGRSRSRRRRPLQRLRALSKRFLER